MRNIFILLASVLLLTTSCATKKYGCGLTSTHTPLFEKNYATFYKSPSYDYCGTGQVCKFDSISGVNTVLIKVNTILRGRTQSDAKFIIVYGSFATTLDTYVGKTIRFECSNSQKEGEVLHVVGGCVESVIIPSQFIVNN